MPVKPILTEHRGVSGAANSREPKPVPRLPKYFNQIGTNDDQDTSHERVILSKLLCAMIMFL